jgi:H/ACA ribonucleoprotein complex non-core subunit NAF1
VDFDPAMSSELEAKGPKLADQAAAVPHTLETTAQKSFELEFGVKDQKVEVVSSELDGLLAPDHLLVSGISDFAVRGYSRGSSCYEDGCNTACSC